ncbi:MAG: polyribonucleotide nucleotidyltransferase [Deltaproteobacteria bacterium RIFCSPLOWO2_12_FULL_43_16]|nr:MAG: polyribonucleotide nucleotidyltransferase [Deltaproteobacteria bacterium GWA2_43_19]OGQ13080.1 MAG: polyribonucleotide nucleotidyltransferase [Deltaproteobacteria bacterium RIFCSPHIGHO2_02_FULL_43_33]OGQ57357.1 MAG: polyribonucleotide nucleotidyltransferase [Deltaproteobacteria bacterium RIFCSPLOWO2_12_FULL_43_16]HBR16298.1 polyribonucleotide nucleotidyltransferase [Deltaproteobacteria bacterium]
MTKQYEIDFGGRPLSIEIGKMAKQANGSAVVRYGDTVVLITACAAKEAAEDRDFLPLTVNYMEMTYAAGKIPGGFFKREGRPTEREVLCSRLIDRPLRPLFPEGYFNETQVIATVLSLDPENDPEIAAMAGASAALCVSDIPFATPIAGVRVGRINGNYICNPTYKEQKESDIDLIVAGSADAIIMVEGGAKMATEDDLLEAMMFAHNSIQDIIKLQGKIMKEIGKPKMAVPALKIDNELTAKIEGFAEAKIKAALNIPAKQERYQRLSDIAKELLAALKSQYEGRESEITKIFEDLKYRILREAVLSTHIRIDGRRLNDIRPITCEVGVLPRTHGSALFTRGETQAMVATTLGTSEDEQKIDALSGWEYKTFMLHYNFPPFSVGEVKMLRGPGRREVGHGALAERSVVKILPEASEFPYTIRVVSDILESNGSSSMATVCGASLSLMDAGVPVKDAVAGIAMGLIKEDERIAVISDILGDEDHLGDMDFKVAGTEDGITGFQMDTKITGVTKNVLKDALYQAKEGRLHILKKMKEALSQPRPELSVHAPRIITIYVKQEKIKDVIGPGGKNIKGIIEKTGVKIDIDDSGKVNIASSDDEAAQKAIAMVKELTQEAEVGKIYLGKVRKIMDFGAFVEIFPGTDGLIHISQLAEERVKDVKDILKEGDEVLVKVLEVDKQGKIRLSRKEALGKAVTS